MRDQSPQQSLKILVAEDSDTDRMLLQFMLRKQGHVVIEAVDGLDAVDAYQKHLPDMVLLDALMPHLDGFEVAEKIKGQMGDSFVPIIFLTSLQEAGSLAKCLEAGGDDVLTKPYDDTMLRAKIHAFSRMMEMHKTVQQQRDQIVEHNQLLLQEQEVAKRVFDQVAHSGCLSAPNIKHLLSPISIFNGDVALAAPNASGNLVVLLGDFTGHGLAAAIGAMPLAQTFYSMLAKGFLAENILSEINKKMHEVLPVGVFCCAIMLEMNFAEGILHTWNGGLPAGILVKASSRETIALTSRHLPLGVLAPREFNEKMAQHAIAPGDRCYIWSDGIVEAENPQGEMYGDTRLNACFERNKNLAELFDEIIADVHHFVGESEMSDDISCIEITAVKPEQFTEVIKAKPISHRDDNRDWRLSYYMGPDELRAVNPVPVLLQILLQLETLKQGSGNLYTLLAELYSNTLEHGILELNSGLKKSSGGFASYYQERQRRLDALQDGYVQFDFHYRCQQGCGILDIEIKDSGQGFDFRSALAAVSSSHDYSGRGVSLVNALADSLEYSEGGSRVHVRLSTPSS
jgi:CheY-like chemotaxis protein